MVASSAGGILGARQPEQLPRSKDLKTAVVQHHVTNEEVS